VKAAVMYEVNKPLVIEDVEIDKPRAREILIRTKAVGVCHSDLHFLDGSFPYPLPVILGHESAGIVEAVGADVRGVKPGDHVITCLTAFCGHCEHCLNGRMNLCISPETRREPADVQRLRKAGTSVNQFANLSSFAEMMLVHEHACVPVRKEMPFDRAALIGCAVLTGVGAVSRTANVRVGDTVAVIGCGAVGLAAINGAAIAGAGRIIAIDRVGSKLNLAKHFGATDVIDAAKEEDVVKKVIEMTGGGVPHSFEAIGLKATAEQAFRMLRRGGTANIIGMIAVGVNIELPGRDFLGEKSVRGCFMGSNRFPLDMPRLVDLYLAGKLKLDELISRRIKLQEVNSAFDELKLGELARSVIMFD
jgi:S-(hydroxymethyl)glutathione dehydrogenase/alcohol dehydrogenase